MNIAALQVRALRLGGSGCSSSGRFLNRPYSDAVESGCATRMNHSSQKSPAPLQMQDFVCSIVKTISWRTCRGVNKTCLRHVFSCDRSGCAARMNHSSQKSPAPLQMQDFVCSIVKTISLSCDGQFRQFSVLFASCGDFKSSMGFFVH